MLWLRVEFCLRFFTSFTAMGAENRKRKQVAEPPRLSVRRCLFGRPDPKETRKFLKEEMRKIDDQNCAQWSFNFHVGSPIKGGDFEWEPINKSDSPDIYTKLYKSVSRQYTPSRWSVHSDASSRVVPLIGSIMGDLSSTSQSSQLRLHSSARRVLTLEPSTPSDIHTPDIRITSSTKKNRTTKRKQVTIPGKYHTVHY